MGPIWGREDPGGPHVGPMNFVIWVHLTHVTEPSVICHLKDISIYIYIYVHNVMCVYISDNTD